MWTKAMTLVAALGAVPVHLAYAQSVDPNPADRAYPAYAAELSGYYVGIPQEDAARALQRLRATAWTSVLSTRVHRDRRFGRLRSQRNRSNVGGIASPPASEARQSLPIRAVPLPICLRKRRSTLGRASIRRRGRGTDDRNRRPTVRRPRRGPGPSRCGRPGPAG